MHVNPPQASTIEPLRVKKAKHLEMIGYYDCRQRREQRENLGAFREESTGDFSNHEGMRQHLSVQEQLAKHGIAMTQVVDPDGGVGQSHAVPERRRGIGRNLF